MDWLLRQKGFASKIVDFCGLFLFLIIIITNYFWMLIRNPRPSFFLLSSIEKVAPFLQTKMGLMMG